MKIGFTGTQSGMSDHQKFYILKWLRSLPSGTEMETHSGDCIGADKDFVDILNHCEEKGWSIFFKKIGHIPKIKTKRAFCQYDEERTPKPYLERNHDIVNESDYIIATPEGNKEQLRSGTWATIRYAKKKGKNLVVIYPDGTGEITSASPK